MLLRLNLWDGSQRLFDVCIARPPSRVQLSHQDAIDSETTGPGQNPSISKVYCYNNGFPQARLLTGLCLHSWTKAMLCCEGLNTGKAHQLKWNDLRPITDGNNNITITVHSLLEIKCVVSVLRQRLQGFCFLKGLLRLQLSYLYQEQSTSCLRLRWCAFSLQDTTNLLNQPKWTNARHSVRIYKGHWLSISSQLTFYMFNARPEEVSTDLENRQENKS